MQRLIAPFAALVLLPALLAVAAPAVRITDVRIANGPQGTQVVLDLSGRADHTLFALANPDRIVVDVASSTLRATAPAGQGVISKIRFGDREDGSTRVVLDLRERVKARSSLAAAGKGYRLTIDLGDGKAAKASGPPQPVKVAHAPDARRDLVIAIDAGHGGVDPGAIGKAGTREKDIALAISRLLAKRIDREEGMRAVLIRDSDQFLSLRERRNRARRHGADLFVSVHADALNDRSVSGSSVYVLSRGRATSENARLLAEKENAADLIGGVSLSGMSDVLATVVLDVAQSSMLENSMKAAGKVLHELDRVGEVRKPQIQQASFAVLASPDMPSMLVETAFISNPHDEKRLKSPAHQEKLANAIFAGVRAYFLEDPPPGTLFAQVRGKKRVAGGEGAR